MKWWIYIALKQLFPTGRGVSFFAAVSILGVALGVLALFGTQSVMNGFHHEIAVKLKDTTGDIIINHGGRPFREDAHLLLELNAMPQVVKSEVVVQGPVMMTYENIPVFPILRSYDTLRNSTALPIVEKNFVLNASLEDLDDDSIILGVRLANSLRATVGDYVSVYSPAMLDKIERDELPMPIQFKIVGYLQTGYSETDANIALVSLRRMRELYNLGDSGAHNIILKLEENADCTAFAKKLNLELPAPMRVFTWLTSNAAFLRVINMEKVMMSLIIMLVILVASFSICISLYTSVLRKTKEIGLICAMGGKPYQIVLCYCLQGFIIGVGGALMGLGLTFLILHFREAIVSFMLDENTLIEFYHLTRLPVKYDFNDGLITCLFAIILCTLAGLIPAFFAARLKVSEAMRNE